ncbi:SDR family oxidoreductase [Cryobacterium sp. TMT1-2-2]|uniref:SDR family NAD(P)-dependent oxidoreductase n=1 Tax=Cryobacterium sp. TMT1-2-2 TaxID=1259233 RepID=UPI0010690A17|nr:SDR family oxidoreductase [Cryobacterium sp. TMT1-2-2]TFD11651.1 SDR family oxidoreductase [Cryobacterium sp. TMT1-2-2]
MSKPNVNSLAVVTGASGGIGRATALRLHAAGYAIVAHYFTNEASAKSLKSEIDSDGGHCFLARADLATAQGLQALVEAVNTVLDSALQLQLHALVNNAARLLGPSFGTATIDQFDEYFALNARAPFFLTQTLAQRMAPGGSIVNISSAGVHFSSPSDIVYAMSKAAVESLTANAAEALAAHRIRINTVIPGFTDNGHDAFNNPDVLAYMSGFSVLGGVSRPSLVAEAVLFLLSENAGRTTGTTLDVSGGSTLGARPKPSISLKDVAT